MGYFLKDPGASIDYSFDWSAGYLAGTGVSASAWSVVPAEPGGLLVASSSHAPERTAALLTGGIAGRVYRLVNRVTLTDGRVDERMLTIRVEDR